MREYSEYRWKDEELYYGEELCFKIVPHVDYEGMWWVVTPAGMRIDFYNIQRAKDNAKKLDMLNNNRSAEEALGEGSTEV